MIVFLVFGSANIFLNEKPKNSTCEEKPKKTGRRGLHSRKVRVVSGFEFADGLFFLERDTDIIEAEEETLLHRGIDLEMKGKIPGDMEGHGLGNEVDRRFQAGIFVNFLENFFDFCLGKFQGQKTVLHTVILKNNRSPEWPLQ